MNFAGSVLRNLGAGSAGARPAHAALEAGAAGTAPRTSPSPRLRTSPSSAWTTATRTARAARLAQAATLLHGDLVFGWRLQLKHRLHRSRLALLCGDAERAPAEARGLAARATELASPATPASPGCWRTARTTRSASRWTGTRWPPTSTCWTRPWPSRPGGGPATWPPTSPSPPGWTGPRIGSPGWRRPRAATRTGCCGRRTGGWAADVRRRLSRAGPGRLT